MKTRNLLDKLNAPTGVRSMRWFYVMVEFVTWWCWRRWLIYCPKGDVSHLFERQDFQRSLFDWDEAFVSPCTLNEINCGGFRGKWTPKIKLLGFEMPEGE